MAAILDEHTQYVDTGGRPLVNGKLYIGDDSADPVANPKTIYSDRALTVVASNPQTLDANGRTTVKLYISGKYSLQVDDSNDVQVYQNLDAGEAALAVSLTGLTGVVGGDTITAQAVPTLTAYEDLSQFIFTATQVNTGVVTLNIDGIGAKSVLKNHDEALVGGEIEADQVVIVIYNATDDVFEITNQNVAPQIQNAKDHSNVNYTASAGSYVVTGTDQHHLIDFTAGGTLFLLGAADLGDGYVLHAKNSTAGRIPINPLAAELIDGLTIYALGPNATVTMVSDGVGWHTISLSDDIGGRISGLTTSNATDAAHDISITPGRCDDDSATPVLMSSGGVITKQIDAVWVAGSGAGGLDAGVVAADTWYHIFIIQNTVTGAVDALFSTSVSAPTLPTDYTRQRRIGSVLTDGSANIIPYNQVVDEWLWETAVQEFNDTNPGTSALTKTVTVPTGLKVEWRGVGSYRVTNSATDEGAYFTPIDEVPDVAATDLNGQLVVTDSGGDERASSELRILTNTSAQIRVRVSISQLNDRVAGTTYGWRDTRGRVT